ncbi:MAG TPA: hypothetical protein VHJ19_06020, partial [Gammaproteobacteria bacterium]|nr:hypothetical protein [Gammaproteobacteria bacterium]
GNFRYGNSSGSLSARAHSRTGLSGGPREEENEIRMAYTLGARAAIERLDKLRDEDRVPEDTTELLRDLYVHRCRGLAKEPVDDDGTNHEACYAALQRLWRELLTAEREAMLRLRETGEISDEAMRLAQRDLDLQESRFEEQAA